jgi:hypothetical protein
MYRMNLFPAKNKDYNGGDIFKDPFMRDTTSNEFFW